MDSILKVLVLTDDYWHPSEVIERGLAALDIEDMVFDVVRTAKDILTPAFVRRYDALVNCKGDVLNAANDSKWFEPNVTEFGPQELKEYVENGGALTVVHSGLTVKEPVYTSLVGSVFQSHPPRETVYLHITENNAITDQVHDFSVRDEPYQIEILSHDIRPFMERTSEHGGTCIAGYTRTPGKGRIAVLTPGHTLSVWENPDFQRLFRQAIRWTVKA